MSEKVTTQPVTEESSETRHTRLFAESYGIFAKPALESVSLEIPPRTDLVEPFASLPRVVQSIIREDRAHTYFA